MPIHDWTRVPDGIYHAFHHRMLSAVADELNAGRLPPGYYALPEQVGGVGYIADISALRIAPPSGGGATTAPAARIVRTARRAHRPKPAAKRVAVRRAGRHETVAVFELMSPGNTSNQRRWRSFLRKATDLLDDGIHLVVLDLFPPGRRNPNGVHAAIWAQMERRPFVPPPDKPLTLVGYDADDPPTAYVEPLAVGDQLAPVPLFLAPELWVPTPLEEAYSAAWRVFPEVWRQVLEN